jgi:transcriptional regulator with XRE-family HTH domain
MYLQPMPPMYNREWTVDADRRFAENFRRERERLGKSQQMIVLDLAGHGLSWHQTTVAKVEAGTRRVNLTEALALSNSLGMTLEDLLEDPNSPALRERRASNLHGRLAEIDNLGFQLRGRRMQLEDELRSLGDEEAKVDGERPEAP